MTTKNMIGKSDISKQPSKEIHHLKETGNEELWLVEKCLNTAREPMVALDMSLRIRLANIPYLNHFQHNEEDTIGYCITDLADGSWDTEPMKELLSMAKTGQKIIGYKIVHNFKETGQRSLLINAEYIEALGLILLAIEDISQSAHIKERLKDIKARFNSMINQSTLGIGQADINGRIIFVNDRFCEITGRSREELLAEHRIQTLTHPEDISRNQEHMDRLFTEGEPFVIEKRYLRPDGSNVWVVFHAHPIKDEEEQILGVSAAVIDISKSKSVENAMRESEERYRLINKATNDIIYDWDLKTDLLYWNDAVTRLGYTKEQIGSTIIGWHDRIHPDDRRRVVENVQKAIDSGAESWVGEYRFMKSDGTYCTSLDRGYIARDSKGYPYRMIGSLLDLTERKKSEEVIMKSQEALRKSDEQYRTLFNSIDEGFCVLEVIFDKNQNPVDYLFLETNPVFEEMTGLKNAKGKMALQMIPDLEKHWLEIYGKVALTGESIRFEEEAKSMGDRWFEVYAFKFGEKDGKKVALLFNNITKRRRFEIALKEAKEKAEKAAQAKEDFLAHMSHEIRTPLNGVIGLTNLLLQQNPNENQLENLRTLKFSAENLRTLVNDILDFSKIQAGKVSVEESNILLRDFLKSIHKSHEAAAMDKGIEIKLNIDERIPEVIVTDQLKLSQTLQNLLGNAVKFTRKGFIWMDVTLNRAEEQKLWIDFSIKDTGIGISPDKFEKIFEVFTQEDSSTMRQFGGTGLGLSICKKLLELLGSQIKVESQPGTGSRFYFTLPVTKGTAVEEDSSNSEPEEEQTDMSQLKVLLVEDVDVNRMVMKQFLSTWWGLIPDEAVDGEQSVEMAREKHYDMILMDIRMPVMDGYQAAQLIRDLPGYKDVPILALTADTAKELKKNPEYGLFTDVIVKPVEPSDLRSKLLDYGTGNKTTSEPLHAAVDLRKLEKLMKSNPDSTRHFLEKVVTEFSRVKQNFSLAMQHQDVSAMDNLEHKGRMMLNLLDLNDLEKHFKYCLSLLIDNASEHELEKARVKGVNMLEHAIASLKEQLEQIQ